MWCLGLNLLKNHTINRPSRSKMVNLSIFARKFWKKEWFSKEKCLDYIVTNNRYNSITQKMLKVVFSHEIGGFFRLKHTVFQSHKNQWLSTVLQSVLKQLCNHTLVYFCPFSLSPCCLLSFSTPKTQAYVPRFFVISQFIKSLLDGAFWILSHT